MASSNHIQIHVPPENNTFPNPVPTSDSQQTPSIISGPITEISSLDGEERLQEATPVAIRSMTGLQVGRSALDPVRPPSAVSSQTQVSARSPPSRRGGPFSGGWRAGGAFGGPGVTRSNSSRPPSAISRTSRTHAPSLAAHAFFHPMSSQRLQAQRRARPSHVNQSEPSVDGSSETGSNTHRRSFGSNVTGQPELSTHNDMGLPPPSRGTDFSEPDERDTVNASPTGNATIQSAGGSERPLQFGTSDTEPKQQNLDDNKQNMGKNPRAQKSHMSFSANFLVSTKRDMPGSKEGRRLGHVVSPNTRPDCAPYSKTPKPGINYQYFSGNTVFCLGGRLQNTRDRPINIMTGLLIVLPSALFLIFSYGAFIYPSLLQSHANKR
jgi:palmitoyltransferase ZDHHC9/14/18